MTRPATGTKTFPWTYPSYMQSFIKILGAVLEENGFKILTLCNFNKDWIQENFFSHVSHWKRFCSWADLKCLFNSDFVEYDFPHRSHFMSLIFRCTDFLWLFKLPEAKNDLSQESHLYFLIFSCTNVTCLLKLPFE